MVYKKKMTIINQIASLNQYKDMLSISHFLFQGANVRIYGTNENPLFKCSDILIYILGYSESNKNRFYQDNKTIFKYVYTLADREGGETQRYFTELGLYRCLFNS